MDDDVQDSRLAGAIVGIMVGCVCSPVSYLQTTWTMPRLELRVSDRNRLQEHWSGSCLAAKLGIWDTLSCCLSSPAFRLREIQACGVPPFSSFRPPLWIAQTPLSCRILACDISTPGQPSVANLALDRPLSCGKERVTASVRASVESCNRFLPTSLWPFESTTCRDLSLTESGMSRQLPSRRKEHHRRGRALPLPA